MSIKSYLVYPTSGCKKELAKELTDIKGCDVINSENEELLIVITESGDKIEEDEIAIISNFLPEQLSENEINDIITHTIKSSGANSIKDMGKVINLIKDEYNGKMDFGVVSKIIKAKLLNL